MTASGDIWALDFEQDQVVYLPMADPSKAKFFCQSTDGRQSRKGMAIDSQGNAWITNSIGTGLDLAVKLKLLEKKLTGRRVSSIA